MIGIYWIVNNVNQKKYIGQSIDVKARLSRHKRDLARNKHQNTHLQRAWNLYKEDNFTFQVLEVCAEKELDDLERFYIRFFNTMNGEYGYNNESGGSLHKSISEESKLKMSLSAKGRYTGEKNPMYGVHLTHTEEWKKEMSRRNSGTGNPMYGVHLEVSEKTKQILSEKFQGESNPFYGRKHTDETKLKMRQNCTRNKPVECVETGVIYRSAVEASEQTGICGDSIGRCCRQKQYTAGGFHWKYVA